ncbi:MAG: type II secretion system protein [Candidatus Roizmanbacteria bacterium]
MKKFQKNQYRFGFTLIELLVVIAILTVLLAITLIAINPQEQFRKANDTKRRSDVGSLLNAVSQWSADNGGVLPTFSSGTPIPTTGANGAGSQLSSASVNICDKLVPKYIAALPVDPTLGPTPGIDATACAGSYQTGYDISQGASSRITILAPNAPTPFYVSR